jgi:hypothetical protein
MEKNPTFFSSSSLSDELGLGSNPFEIFGFGSVQSFSRVLVQFVLKGSGSIPICRPNDEENKRGYKNEHVNRISR